MIRAISFDGDDTLWDFDRVMRQALQITLDELRRRFPGKASAHLSVEKMISIRDQVESEMDNGSCSLEQIRFMAFERTVERFSNDLSLATELNALYLKHRFEDIELFPDVMPVLDNLSDSYCLGLLSNGNTVAENCGLGRQFQFSLFAHEIGYRKPDPRIFAVACRSSHCEPRQLMHVGDSLQSDVAGANAVGAISIWLNRRGATNNSDIIPVHEITSLSELPDIVNQYS